MPPGKSAEQEFTATLPGGGKMPLLGFGTWQLTGSDAQRATEVALQNGYHHVDTATMYQNEAEVGAALKTVPRDDVFVTTKLLPDAVGREQEALEQSLTRLGLQRLDLWLVHWPPAEESLVSVWEALLRAREKGLVTDIGVSNYSLAQLDALAEATGTMPAVNQIRWSPLLFDPVLQQGHRERSVVLEGYSALRGGALTDPVVERIAAESGRTAAQVIIRWHLQHDTVVIPKSADEHRIRDNADVFGFSLSDEQMAALDALGG
ncbi:MAG: aldo/keto reductase [Frankiales bacterium]|nr:aldo/keto reductase [Frankiales bacterium]